MSYIVLGLDGSTTYRMRIVANNFYGASNYSKEFKFSTAGKLACLSY